MSIDLSKNVGEVSAQVAGADDAAVAAALIDEKKGQNRVGVINAIHAEQARRAAGRVTRYRVSASAPGYRRAGRAWSVEPVEISDAEFSARQIEQLEADPGIHVEKIG